MHMKKIKKDNLAIMVAIVLVVVYIFYQCYSVTHVDLETQTAVTTTVYEKIDASALIIREEQVISNSTSGVTVACLSDGDKINVGGNVAMVFSSSDKATNYSRYLDIEEELNYYEDLESQSMGQAVSVESIDKEINENVYTYIRSLTNASSSTVDTAASNVNASLTKRQLIIGEDIDFGSITQQLRKEQQEITSSSCKPDKYITTDVSGIFTQYTDGFEDMIDYSKVEDITVDQVNDYLEQTKNSTQTSSDNLGKLVTSYNWYMACVVDADSLSGLSDGGNVNVVLKDNDDTVLKAEIVKGADVAADAKESVLLLKCNDMNAKLASQRTEDIEIRCNTYTGIKVPVESVHVVDGKKGVYALISSQVKFREADVIYTTDDYVLLSYDPDNDNGIRLYDKIIIQGKDLEDGKVYT